MYLNVTKETFFSNSLRVPNRNVCWHGSSELHWELFKVVWPHIPDLNDPGEEILTQDITVINCINIIDILLINRRFALIMFYWVQTYKFSEKKFSIQKVVDALCQCC